MLNLKYKKMKKIKLYQLAFYLPYQLKYFRGQNIYELKNLHYFYSLGEDSDCVGKTDCTRVNDVQTAIFGIKPILKPLIYLTEKIEHNGEKFIPILRLLNLEKKELVIKEIYHIKNSFNSYSVGVKHHHVKHRDNICIASLSFGKGNLDTIRFDYVQKLLEWHFDIFDLIDAGLAVDFYTW